MPRKINFSEPKIIELLQALDEMNFPYIKAKDSIDITLSNIKEDKKRIVHLLSQINTEFKTPPLIQQVVEGESIMSVYDQRM